MGEFEDARETWDRRFAEADGLLFGSEPNPWLAEHHRLLPAGGKVLCVADGESRNGVFLAAAGFDVTAFDISPVAIEKARALAGQRGVEIDLRVADAARWGFEPDAFDAVVAIFIQFADPDLRERLFAGFRRTLRPGGVLLIEGYGERQLRYRTGGPGIPENLYQARRLHQAKEEQDRLGAMIGALSFEPLAHGVRSRAEALHVLGFAPGAAPDARAVRERFRQLARVHHPDSAFGDNRRMIQLNEAVQILQRGR